MRGIPFTQAFSIAHHADSLPPRHRHTAYQEQHLPLSEGVGLCGKTFHRVYILSKSAMPEHICHGRLSLPTVPTIYFTTFAAQRHLAPAALLGAYRLTVAADGITPPQDASFIGAVLTRFPHSVAHIFHVATPLRTAPVFVFHNEAFTPCSEVFYSETNCSQKKKT